MLFMNILLIEKSKETQPLYLFFKDISEGLCHNIYKKFQSYVEYGDVYHGNNLKTLNSRIWKYKGTIYKLRIDNGKESARMLFARSKNGDLIIIHAFLKSTRKTPKKEARQAIAMYQMLETLQTTCWDQQFSFSDSGE